MNADKLIFVHNFISVEDMKNINKHLADMRLSKIKYENDVTVKNKTSNYYKKLKSSVNLPSRWVERHENNLVYELLDVFVPSTKDEIEASFGKSVLPENGYSINVYLDGEELPKHNDGDSLIISTPNGNPKREISSILYLNEDFEGGEVYFPNQGVVLKPKPGMLVLFPSTNKFIHSVSKVTSGARYTIPQFWSIKQPNETSEK